jgi:voltage-gated potassium channel
MTGWRRWLRLAALLGLVVVLYFTVPVTLERRADEVVQLVVSLAVLAILSVAVVWEVRLQIVDADRRIDGLVLALTISVLAFALGFYVMDQRSPGQLVGIDTRLDALYFTVTTLLTVGFGDIHAEGQAARALVLVQMLFNIVIITTAASTLATRVRTRAESRAESRRTASPERSAAGHRRQGRRTRWQ